MINRILENKLIEISRYYPVIALNGPRQSGKTTLIKSSFTHLPYVTLEDPDNMQLAINDPRAFLNTYKKGAILDEVQRVPNLFSYLQGIVDADSSIKFVLSGSQNFLLNQNITQSLAGRVGLLTLLPFSFWEVTEQLAQAEYEDVLYKGFYPRIYDANIPPELFYPNYIQTYIERDVRQLSDIRDLNAFIRFLKLCAGRIGQLLNLSSLSNDTGISVNTAKAWISVLEASYIIYLLQPHHKNFNKRLTKSPKLYFYDTGLACSLLDIESPNQLRTHYAKGNIFESFVITEFIKKRYNQGKRNNIYFWRDHKGKEIDCLIEIQNKLTPIEIKSARTKSDHYFSGIRYWNKLSGNSPDNSYVIYGGDENQHSTSGQLIAWNQFNTLFET